MKSSLMYRRPWDGLPVERLQPGGWYFQHSYLEPRNRA